MATNNWITNLVTAVRTSAMLAMLARGFAPADVLALCSSAQRSAVFVPAQLPTGESFGYSEAA